MLRSISELGHFSIEARDGKIGKVNDVFFDDDIWIVRYLVVDTGGWLSGRKVLITPAIVDEPDDERRQLPVNLTKDQVTNSPNVDAAPPVSRQREIELFTYYGWPFYWTGTGAWAGGMAPLAGAPMWAGAQPQQRERNENADPHLRSAREVIGYHIEAKDGEIGHVDDFIVDDSTWVLRYLVVSTRNWLPGRKVLIATQWLVQRVSWTERKVKVFMTRDSVKNSPEFDPKTPVDRQYETALHEHYGREGYWAEEEARREHQTQTR